MKVEEYCGYVSFMLLFTAMGNACVCKPISETKLSSALLKAAANGNNDEVLSLLELGADVDAQNEEGDTALMRAASKPYIEVVHSLLDHGADTNIQDNHGETALIKAARYGLIDVIKCLLENGESINIQDNRGDTALINAVKCSWSTVHSYAAVQTLVEHGADINIQNKLGRTALMLTEQRDVIQYLQEHGAEDYHEGLNLVYDSNEYAYVWE